MDKKTSNELKSHLKWFLTQSHIAWLIFAFSLILLEGVFSDYEGYEWITLAFAIVYTFSMCMFMYKLRDAMNNGWRRIESRNMKFISEAIATGRGTVEYMCRVHDPEGFISKWRVRLFGITYLRPYDAQFLDDGSCAFKAHLEIPVTKKQMFQLKLIGGYETSNREQAVKALELLEVDWPLP